MEESSLINKVFPIMDTSINKQASFGNLLPLLKVQSANYIISYRPTLLKKLILF